MNKKLAVIGGDLRIVKLVEMLIEDKYEIYINGLEKAEELKDKDNLFFCNSISDAVQNANLVIAPIPFSKDGIKINTPFSDNIITINSLIQNLKGKRLVAGSISTNIATLLEENNIKLIDVMKDEELVILNTIATAEGTIKEAISNTDIILHKSNVLILGFGRVAKTLAVKFSGLSANVTCSARKEKDLAWIETYGYNALNINYLGNELNKFDIIINTVPHMILGENELQYVRKDCLLIDVSSKPGGMDEKYIKENGLNMIWALALPGKVASKTSAEFIKKTIFKLLKEENIKI